MHRKTVHYNIDLFILNKQKFWSCVSTMYAGNTHDAALQRIRTEMARCSLEQLAKMKFVIRRITQHEEVFDEILSAHSSDFLLAL